MRFTFKDKVVIVTGASSGIGKSCAYKLIQEGAKVALVSRNKAELDKVHDLCKESAGSSLIRLTDIGNIEDVKAMVKEVVAYFGRIDILINNAGIGSKGLAISTPLEALEKMMKTNFYGAVYCLREVYPYMKKQGRGVIVNVSSIAGLKAIPNQAFYSATKFALRGFSDAFAIEAEQDNIRVILVSPGKTITNFENNLLYSGGAKNLGFKGMGADKAANKILKAVKSNKRFVILGWKNYMFYLLDRISPNFTNKILRWLKKNNRI